MKLDSELLDPPLPPTPPMGAPLTPLSSVPCKMCPQFILMSTVTKCLHIQKSFFLLLLSLYPPPTFVVALPSNTTFLLSRFSLWGDLCPWLELPLPVPVSSVWFAPRHFFFCSRLRPVFVGSTFQFFIPRYPFNPLTFPLPESVSLFPPFKTLVLHPAQSWNRSSFTSLFVFCSDGFPVATDITVSLHNCVDLNPPPFHLLFFSLLCFKFPFLLALGHPLPLSTKNWFPFPPFPSKTWSWVTLTTQPRTTFRSRIIMISETSFLLVWRHWWWPPRPTVIVPRWGSLTL